MWAVVRRVTCDPLSILLPKRTSVSSRRWNKMKKCQTVPNEMSRNGKHGVPRPGSLPECDFLARRAHFTNVDRYRRCVLARSARKGEKTSSRRHFRGPDDVTCSRRAANWWEFLSAAVRPSVRPSIRSARDRVPDTASVVDTVSCSV